MTHLIISFQQDEATVAIRQLQNAKGKGERTDKMSVCSRKTKCSVCSDEMPQLWAASADAEGIGLLLVILAHSRIALLFLYSSVHPTRQHLLQENILKHLLDPTRLSMLVNYWLFLAIPLPLLCLEFLPELLPVEVAIPLKDLKERGVNGEFITQNMRTYTQKITINQMKVTCLVFIVALIRFTTNYILTLIQ